MKNPSAEETITLNLTKAEVLLLQERVEYIGGGYAWQIGIAQRLKAKALEAYRKPTLSQADFLAQLKLERDEWRGIEVEERMVRAKSHELRFFYRVEGEDDGPVCEEEDYADDDNEFVYNGSREAVDD